MCVRLVCDSTACEVRGVRTAYSMVCLCVCACTRMHAMCDLASVRNNRNFCTL